MQAAMLSRGVQPLTSHHFLASYAAKDSPEQYDELLVLADFQA